MNTIKAVIFDFDGVIIDTETIRNRILNEYLEPHGISIDKEDKTIIGMKTKHYIKEKHPHLSDETIHDVWQQWDDRKSKDIAPLIPGVKNLISYLRRKTRIIITTGSSEQAVLRPLEHYGIEGFEFGIYGENYTTSKPDPECYDIALKKAGLEPREAIIIEDSEAGVRAGKGAGCTVFGIGTYLDEEKLKRAGADEYFKDHKELLERFKELFN